MASGSHVSKRKSSSSSSHHKKKKSSEGKKRSRSRKRDKSKKLLPLRDVSVSSSDEESVYSEGDDYKRRKGRSRAREDAKSKKRVKRSSSISESPVRKKRRDSSKLKKKLHKKKSKKRDVSVDSSGSDSRDLSLGSASDDAKRLRVRNKVKQEVKNKSGNEDRYKYRSRSCSSCSEGSYDHSEERLASGSYAGRLRSVLTFPDKVEVEGRYQSKDENKVEIIHAYDDPPPCKSNDSYEVGRKRESLHQASTLPEKKSVVCDGMVEDGRRKESYRELNVPPEKETRTLNGNGENATLKTKMVGMVEDERRKEFSHQVKIVPEKKTNTCENVEDAFTSKSRMTQSTKGIKGDAVAAHGGIYHTANMESTKTANKSEVSSGIVSSELSDLESKLRQKALENFRKFRGGCQPNTTLSDLRSGNGVNETTKTESSKEVGSTIVRANDTKASEMKHSSTEVMEGIAVTKSPIRGVKVPDCDSKRLESHDTIRATHPPVRRIPNGNSKRLDICDTRNAANPSQGSGKFVSDRLVDTKTTEKRIINLGGIRKFNHGSLVYRRQASQDYSEGKAQETRSMLNRVVSEPPKAAAESSNPCKSATSEPTSCSTPAAGEQVTTESGNAAKGNSEAKCPETKYTLNKNVPSPPKAAAVGSSNLPKSNKSPGSGASESGNAGNGGSEFKQKTMSVMRGGEMVQVSYKVYIPQKPPALARRQLKR